MDSIESYAVYFATPYHGSASPLIEMIARSRFKSTRDRIANQLSKLGEQSAHVATLSYGTECAWTPEVGLAYEALTNGRPALAALQIACAVAATGGHCEVSVDSAETGYLFLQGWLMPVAGRYAVRSSADLVSMSNGELEVEFRRHNGRWEPTNRDRSEWIACSPLTTPFYMVNSGIVVDGLAFPTREQYPNATPHHPDIAESHASHIAAGWSLVTEMAPIYTSWIASTTRGALMVEHADARATTSGSCFNRPGLLFIQPTERPRYVGDCLVHECSHQHMNAYSLMAPLVNREFEESFFSPIKGQDRTTYNVLQAAHALANMILYYHEVRQHVSLKPYELKKLAMLEAWFSSDYSSALDMSKALTPAGQEFWRCIKAAVNEARLGCAA